MVVRNGWIFSDSSTNWSSKDVIVFTLPIIWGLILTLFLDQNSLYFSRPGILISAVFTLFLDFPHAWSTFLKVGMDQEGFKRNTTLYVGIPIFCFFIILSFAAVSIPLATSLVAYVNMYHSLRQEYGWVMLSRRKGEETDSVGLFLDKLWIYALTGFTIIWLHSLTKADAWWLFPNDLIFVVPVWFARISQMIFFAVTGLYISYLLLRIIRGEAINLSKLFFMSMIGVAWYVGLVHFTGVTWMLDSLHAFSYIFFVFKYKTNKSLLKVSAPSREYLLNQRSILIYLSMVAVSYIMYRFLLTDNPIVFALLFVPSMSHYILDGFIWKFGKTNNDLNQVFGLKPAPRTL